MSLPHPQTVPSSFTARPNGFEVCLLAAMWTIPESPSIFAGRIFVSLVRLPHW